AVCRIPLRSTKSEIRSTKSETNSKHEVQNVSNGPRSRCLRHSYFGFVSDFGFRISCFRLRASDDPALTEDGIGAAAGEGGASGNRRQTLRTFSDFGQPFASRGDNLFGRTKIAGPSCCCRTPGCVDHAGCGTESRTGPPV